MHRKRNGFIILIIGILLLATAGLWAAGVTDANAQCGSQASSCKNCHEVQEKDPVNKDGTPWHTEHAFGDFCYICHAGNNQAVGEAEAHAGMVPPLADIKASCQQCHPNNMKELAQVYADRLGVVIGEGRAAAPSESAQPPVEVETSSISGIMVPTELDVDDPNLIDFVQRYNEIVLGKRRLNTGNIILGVLIGLVALGGGGFVLSNEYKLSKKAPVLKTIPEGYPQDVLEMLPAIARLSKKERTTLKKILDDPQRMESILKLVETIEGKERQLGG